MTDSSPFNFVDLLSSFVNNPQSHCVSGDSSEASSDDLYDEYDWKSAYETISKDFSSYKKRMELAKSNERKNLTKEIIRGFLDVVDYIIFTYKAKNANGNCTKEDDMVLGKMFQFLEQYDVRPMKGIEGKPFDHNFHDAILVDSSGTFEDDIVTVVISQGYMMGDEVLRHAKVCVSKST